MRNLNKTSRVLVIAMASALAAPLAAQEEGPFWSAQPTGTAWVTSYGECWQSIHGPNDLDPCVKAVVPKEFTVKLNFEFDKYRLENIVNDSELDRLRDYVETVKKTPTREEISLVGHTDAKGSDAYNMALGQRRADTVRDYMVSQGIPASDIVSVESRGKRDLLPGVDPFSVEQRRVVINAEYENR